VGREKEPTKLQQFFHFWRLVGQSFIRNRLPVRAASLSYTTILALVPMLAVAVGITSSLLKDQSEERIGSFVDELVENIVPAVVVTNEIPEGSSLPGVDTDGVELPGSDDVGNEADVEGDPATNALAQASGPAAGQTNAPAGKPRILNEDVQKDVARQIKKFIQNTRSGTLGVVGTVVLIFLAISMLIRIEDAFNHIWGVLKGRSPFMRLVLYWTVISLAPVLFAVALGLASGPYFKTTERLISDIPLIGWLLFQLLPLVVLSLAFAVFYMLMPYTKVRWNAALIGGVAAALLWHGNNSLSALYVSRVAMNINLYGSLGLVPVFMVGLYFAWMILLFGGQVSYAWQNRLSYFQERVSDNVNQRGREFVALRLMTAIGAAYQRAADPPSHAELASTLEIPPRLTLQVLQTLIAARLVTEVSGAESAYVPARPIESISCYDILHAMRAGQGNDATAQDGPLQRQILGEFLRINEAEKQAAEKVSVLAMADRANTLLGPASAGHNSLTNGAP
jgi:membrane protein